MKARGESRRREGIRERIVRESVYILKDKETQEENG
jgi:hypothetical protein